MHALLGNNQRCSSKLKDKLKKKKTKETGISTAEEKCRRAPGRWWSETTKRYCTTAQKETNLGWRCAEYSKEVIRIPEGLK